MRYCLPICVVCVSSHLWTVPRQIWFWKNLTKSWDSVRPPPLVGPKDQLFPFFVFDGSPYICVLRELSCYVKEDYHQCPSRGIGTASFDMHPNIQKDRYECSVESDSDIEAPYPSPHTGCKTWCSFWYQFKLDYLITALKSNWNI